MKVKMVQKNKKGFRARVVLVLALIFLVCILNAAYVFGASLVDGKFGKALDFDGAGDYVSVANDASLNPGAAVTVSVWVKPDTLSGTRQIVDFMHNAYAGYMLRFEGGKVNFPINGGSGQITSSTTISAGSWTHIAGTYDSSTSGMNIYINGVLDKTGSYSSAISSYGAPLYIGTRSGTHHFDGKIDDVRIYNKALTADEAKFLAAQGLPGTDNLVGHWKMDDVLESCVAGHTDNGDGTCTVTFNPDAGTGGTTVDGDTQQHHGSPVSFSTLRAGSGTQADSNSATTVFGDMIETGGNANTFSRMRRLFILFDTSSLPDGATIYSATFEFVATDKVNAFSGSISLVTSTPASNTNLVASDFPQFGTIRQADDITIASLTVDSSTFNVMTLNNIGLGNVNTAGITKFGLRSAFDVNNIAPTWAAYSKDNVKIASADTNLGADKKPKLIVTYLLNKVVDSSGKGNIGTISGNRAECDTAGGYFSPGGDNVCWINTASAGTSCVGVCAGKGLTDALVTDWATVISGNNAYRNGLLGWACPANTITADSGDCQAGYVPGCFSGYSQIGSGNSCESNWVVEKGGWATMRRICPCGGDGPTSVDGKLGKALSFDGVNDYVHVPDDPTWDFGSNDFGIAFWVKFDSFAGSPRPISHFDGTNGWFLGAAGTGGHDWVFRTPPYPTFTWDGAVDTWYHIAVSRTGNTLRMFVDGVQLDNDKAFDVTVEDTNTGLLLGTQELPINGPLNGMLDDVRIYNKGLTANEVKLLSELGVAKLIAGGASCPAGYKTTSSGADVNDDPSTGASVYQYLSCYKDVDGDKYHDYYPSGSWILNQGNLNSGTGAGPISYKGTSGSGGYGDERATWNELLTLGKSYRVSLQTDGGTHFRGPFFANPTMTGTRDNWASGPYAGFIMSWYYDGWTVLCPDGSQTTLNNLKPQADPYPLLSMAVNEVGTVTFEKDGVVKHTCSTPITAATFDVHTEIGPAGRTINGLLLEGSGTHQQVASGDNCPAGYVKVSESLGEDCDDGDGDIPSCPSWITTGSRISSSGSTLTHTDAGVDVGWGVDRAQTAETIGEGGYFEFKTRVPGSSNTCPRYLGLALDTGSWGGTLYEGDRHCDGSHVGTLACWWHGSHWTVGAYTPSCSDDTIYRFSIVNGDVQLSIDGAVVRTNPLNHLSALNLPVFLATTTSQDTGNNAWEIYDVVYKP